MTFKEFMKEVGNDDVFCYCNGIESFKQLTEYGVGEFIVTFCWSFF